MGRTYLSERLTNEERVPNVQNVVITNDKRIHNVSVDPLTSAQNFEHVQNLNEATAYLCESWRIANEYNERITCHERLATYASVSHTLGVR